MKKFVIVMLFLLPLVYIFFFPASIGTQLLLKPIWGTKIPSEIKSAAHSDPRLNDAYFSYQLFDDFGFVTQDGEILSKQIKNYNVALSDNRYINYSSVSKNLVVQDPSGRFLLNIEEKAYPIIRNNRLFTISTDRLIISEFTWEGDKLWEHEFFSPITSLHIESDYTTLGTLAGKAVLYNNEGTEIFSVSSETKSPSPVYGVSVSRDGEQVVVISGINPQMLRIYRKGNESYRLTIENELDSEFRRNTRIWISPDTTYVYAERPEGIYQVEVPSGESTQFSLQGIILAAEEIQEAHVITFLIKEDRKLVLQFKRHGTLTMSEISLGKYDRGYMRSYQDDIILGFQNTLCRISTEEL